MSRGEDRAKTEPMEAAAWLGYRPPMLQVALAQERRRARPRRVGHGAAQLPVGLGGQLRGGEIHRRCPPSGRAARAAHAPTVTGKQGRAILETPQVGLMETL